MSRFFAVMRRLALGAAAISIFSSVLTACGSLPSYALQTLLGAALLYLLFAVFSWLLLKHSIENTEDPLYGDLTKKSFAAVLFRILIIDIASPVTAIVDFCRRADSSAVILACTYAIIVGCMLLWVAMMH